MVHEISSLDGRAILILTGGSSSFFLFFLAAGQRHTLTALLALAVCCCGWLAAAAGCCCWLSLALFWLDGEKSFTFMVCLFLFPLYKGYGAWNETGF